MQFEIYRESGAQYHWRLVGDDGIKLAVSATTFGSARAAHRAAAEVRLNAASADDVDVS